MKQQPTLFLLLAVAGSAVASPFGVRPFHPLATYLHPELYGQYHRGLRPNHGTDVPTVVTANLFVRRVDKVDAENDLLGMDITFRQKWNDPRLKHDQEPFVTLSGKNAWERIWVPDTFFRNSVTERTHDLPTANQYARVFPNGDVLISQRLV